eukprot:scaffold3348_cov113-Isochrysis_galbana.AAC.2
MARRPLAPSWLVGVCGPESMLGGVLKMFVQRVEAPARVSASGAPENEQEGGCDWAWRCGGEEGGRAMAKPQMI